MTRATRFITSVIFFSSFSFAALADDLLSVYQLALKNDSQFRAAQAEYSALQELKPQSISALLPTLSLSGNVSRHNEKNTSSSANTSYQYNSNGYSINLVQPLYRNENFVALDKADAQVMQAVIAFENSKQDLILRVAKNYFAVLAAKDEQSFAQTERKAINEQLLQARQRFNVGLIAITDVHEAQARYDQAVASAIVAENAVAISLQTLREITSTDHTNLVSLANKHPLPTPKPENIEQWVGTALSQNILLRVSKKNVDIAKAEVSRQQGSHYPTLDLTAKHSYNDIDGGALGEREQNNNIVALQLNIPLYQGGMVNSRTRAAAHRLTQAQALFEQQKRATERQVRNAYLSVIANISQAKALKQALASSSIALEATQASFEVGSRTTVDVLNSQRELYRARRDYAQARYNYFLETLKLKYAAGTLSALDVEQLNPWFN